MSLLEDYIKEKKIDKSQLENYIKKNVNKNIVEIYNKIEKLLSIFTSYKIEKWIPLINWVTTQYTTGFLKELKRKNAWELLLSLVIVKSIYEKNYSTTIIYTSQSREKGLGYYLDNETPTEEELIEESKRHIESIYRIQWFSANEGYLYEIITTGELQKELKREIEESPIDSRGFSFERFSIYNQEVVSSKKKENLLVKYPNIVLFIIIDYLLTKMFLEKKLPSSEDCAEIYIVSNKLVHRRHYIFPNISEIYNLFYSKEEDFEIFERKGLKGEIIREFSGSKLSKFLLSLWIKHKDYSEKSLIILDKLIYYLFNYGKINGQLLDRLIENIVTYCKKENKVVKIKYIEKILKSFWKLNIMNPHYIKKWGEKIGEYILSEYKNKYKLDENRAKKIIKRIIDELKVEYLPGRFFEKLIKLIRDYDLPLKVSSSNIEIDITKIFEDENIKNNMDNFLYAKALIISGLLQSL